MKKIIVFLALFLMMISSASALVTYTGQPQFPYIIYGHLDWQNQNLGGARIEITNQNTGFSTIITTNIDGYWQEDGSNWETISSARPPVLFGDVIKVKTLDGCGTNDVCEKTFSVFSSGFENSATIDLSVTGVLVVTIPSDGGGSSGGSSGGGGGGGGGSVPAWDCAEWTACDNGQQVRICTQGQFTSKEKRVCVVSEPIVVPPITEPTIPTEPKEPTTPTKPETPTEPEVPEDETDLFIYLLELAGIILAALGVQWYRGILGIVKYHWKAGRKAQAIKTLFTLVKKAKEGTYNKK